MSHRLGYSIIDLGNVRRSRPYPTDFEVLTRRTVKEDGAILVGCLLLVLFIAAATAGSPVSSGPVAGPALAQGNIAFMSNDRDGSWHIYRIEASGLNRTCLVDTPGQDLYPALSPDGARVAFVSDCDGSSQLYVTRFGETQRIRLTDMPGRKADPAWSPDGQRLAFAADSGGSSQIYVIGADGGGLVNLTHNTEAYAGHPSWSPDGARLVFDGLPRNGPDYDIYMMNADGTDVRDVTNDLPNERLPAWSPDGRRIAFMSDGGNYPWDIWVMDADGQNSHPVTSGPGLHEHPSWSPDGQQIVFQFGIDGRQQLYTVNLEDNHLTRLSQDVGNDEAPFWGS